MNGSERNFGVGILLSLRDSFSAGAQKAERSFKGLSGAADIHARRIEQSMLRIKRGALMMGAGVAMMAAAAVPVKMASDWSYGMAEVSTLVNTATFDMDRFSKGVLKIAASVGDVSEASQRAAYDLLSGIQGLTETQYLAVYEKAAKAAVAGVSDINTSLNLGMGILNAYGMDVNELDRLYDQLFTTVQLGVTTYSELGGSLGKVLTTAKLAKVEVGQVLGGVAALTKAGIPTSEAVTAINALLMAMAAPEEKASKELERLGGAAYVAARESGDLIEQMRIFAPLVKNLADIRKLTPEREAIKAFGALTQNLKQFIEIARQTSDPRAGTYLEAFDKMAKEMKKKLEVIGATLKRFMILAGMPLLSVLTPVADKFGKLLTRLADFAEGHPGLSKAVLVLVGGLGALVFILGTGFMAAGLFGLAMTKAAVGMGFYSTSLGPAIAGTWALLGPWVAVLAIAVALAAAVYLVIKNWKAIEGFFVGLWGRIVGGIRSFVATIKEVFKKVADFFLAPFRAIWAAIQKAISYIPNWALPAGLERLKTAAVTAGTIGVTAIASPATSVAAMRPVVPAENRVPRAMSGSAQVLEREVVLNEQLRKPEGLTEQQAERMIQKLDDFSRKSIEMKARLFLDSDQIAETVSKRQYQRHMERGPR